MTIYTTSENKPEVAGIGIGVKLLKSDKPLYELVSTFYSMGYLESRLEVKLPIIKIKPFELELSWKAWWKYTLALLKQTWRKLYGRSKH